MEWTDEGIVLGVRAHGETAAVLELLTREHGRHLGLVHGGQSRRSRPLLQTGNHVDVTWKARLSENLGHFTVTPRRAYGAAAMDDAAALAGLASMTTLARLLPERDPHPSLYEVTLFVLGFLDDETAWPALVVRWELALLDELGFGLDLTTCAVTGGNDALIYVSPRTGKAVSASAGEPYRDRLLALPPFLRPRPVPRLAPHSANASRGARLEPVTPEALRNGFHLTGHFLHHSVLAPREMALPEPRKRLVAIVTRDETGPVVI